MYLISKDKDTISAMELHLPFTPSHLNSSSFKGKYTHTIHSYRLFAPQASQALSPITSMLLSKSLPPNSSKNIN